ncbi:hypothetical protein HPB47_000381 [Ixodes persulcatus]|uniref:Uncharacterized protein n=1 Tax=Ixodes persulcatus TaxID=34615 RepID=A0AC60PRX0_IXOPE|nr:hypothetical protein HPB47_000381 [Ixodes persulcatus]
MSSGVTSAMLSGSTRTIDIGDERQYPHPDLDTSWDDDVKRWPDIRSPDDYPRPSGLLVGAVNRELVNSYGEVEFNVHIGPEGTKMVLDFPKKRIQLQGLALHPELCHPTNSPDTASVQCLKELHLPPKTEALIQIA